MNLKRIAASLPFLLDCFARNHHIVALAQPVNRDGELTQ